MSKWRRLMTSLGYSAETQLDAIKARFFSRMESDRRVYVQPYRWYGTPDRLAVRGRVLRDNGLSAALDEDSLWDNLLNSYRRFSSDEVPFAQLRVRFGEQVVDVETDEEGYFSAEIHTTQPLAPGWHSAEVILPDDAITVAECLVVDDSAEFGVISDIDDTILETHATNLLKVARLTFLGNARTRLPFAGVAAFYNALQRGRNPIFYVSSSPWNLYDLLVDFMAEQDIPAGPLNLRDIGIDQNKFITTGHGNHKIEKIRAIMDSYPSLPFVLIGDSGQHDPEIYREIAARYPGRVHAIYIRDVAADERDVEVKLIADGIDSAEMLLVSDSIAAARHAQSLNLIAADQLAVIEADVRESVDRLA